MFSKSFIKIRPIVRKINFYKSSLYFSTSKTADAVIIGGGPGGYACAIKAAQLGLKTICIEGRGALGGTCLNVGCIPSKALLHNTHLYHEAKHDFANRGIIIDGNIKMDLNKLLEVKNNAVSGLTKGIESLFKKNKVEYVKGWGKITNNNNNEIVVLDNNGKDIDKINAKKIIIATGSEPTPLPKIPIDEKDIVSSTGALEFKTVPKKLVIVGAGVIGLELGSVWGRLGSEVVVIEYLDRILPGIDADIAKKFQTILKNQGVTFHLGSGVQDIKKNNNILTTTYKENKTGKETTIESDKVLIAIGRRPFTKNLGLEDIKIKMDGSRVAVNDHWQSLSHSNIYAIGDVIKGPMLAHKAEEEGIAVAEILAGKSGHVNYNAIPGVVYTYPELATVGKTEEELKDKNIPYNKGEFQFLANSRARTNNDTQGLVKILAHKETDRILGVHIIGPNAGEMIAEGVIGIEYGASSEDLGRTTHAHPTLSEAFKEACMKIYAGNAIHL